MKIYAICQYTFCINTSCFFKSLLAVIQLKPLSFTSSWWKKKIGPGHVIDTQMRSGHYRRNEVLHGGHLAKRLSMYSTWMTPVHQSGFLFWLTVEHPECYDAYLP